MGSGTQKHSQFFVTQGCPSLILCFRVFPHGEEFLGDIGLQKIRRLSQWARQASSEVQRRAAANRQLQQSQPLQTVSGPLAIGAVGAQSRVRTPVSSFQVASAPSDPVVQQAVQLQALVQQMGMAGTIRGTTQGIPVVDIPMRPWETSGGRFTKFQLSQKKLPQNMKEVELEGCSTDHNNIGWSLMYILFGS